MFKNLKLTIGRKLSIGYGILILAIVINVSFTIYTTRKNASLNKDVSLIYGPTESNLNALSNLVVNSKMLIKNWVFIDKKSDTPDKLKLKDLQDKDFIQIKTNLDALSESEKWLPEDRVLYKQLIVSISDTLFGRQKEVMNKLKDFASYDDPTVIFDIIPMVEEGGTLMKQTDRILGTLTLLTARQTAKVEDARKKMDQSFANFQWMIFITGIILIVLAFAAGFFTILSIVKPLRKGVEFAKSLGTGNLMSTVDINQSDEIGELAESLKDMVMKLRDIITKIFESAEKIASTGQEMNNQSQQLSQGASDQASSTEEVSSSMEEMVSNIQQNTENAQQTEKIALTASGGINRVREASLESVKSIKAIAEKISIVNDIAFQTNILALNAAVEAARAGEHGRGFAVVAAEVRKLAENSKTAADEIQILAKNSVQTTEEAGNLLINLAPEIERTAKLVQEITAASVEQNAGVDQINNSIQQLNHITQQNAVASDEISKNAKALHDFADELRDYISFFQVEYIKKKAEKSSTKSTNSKFTHASVPVVKSEPTAVKPTEHKQPVAKPGIAKKTISRKPTPPENGKGVNLNMFGSDTNNDSEYEKF